jgi:hypothetical protein
MTNSENPRMEQGKNPKQDSKHAGQKNSGRSAQAEVPPPPNEERKTEYKKDVWFYFKFGVEILTLLFLIRYTILTGRSVEIAQNVFNVTNRPYVGVDKIVHRFVGKGENGQQIVSEHPGKGPLGMEFIASFKNFGIVPARNSVIDWTITVGGVEIGGRKIPDKPSTFFPSGVENLKGGIEGTNYTNVMNGTRTLELVLHISYDGPQEHSTDCVRERFDPDANVFFNLGAC